MYLHTVFTEKKKSLFHEPSEKKTKKEKKKKKKQTLKGTIQEDGSSHTRICRANEELSERNPLYKQTQTSIVLFLDCLQNTRIHIHSCDRKTFHEAEQSIGQYHVPLVKSDISSQHCHIFRTEPLFASQMKQYFRLVMCKCF